ncbi:MAG: hypothetical protein QF743_08315, partial [Candidatus Marinimicrobia bacterium]|nr:hypothetical protein [Candidatus Neomarinimicrobiota bacterium]
MTFIQTNKLDTSKGFSSITIGLASPESILQKSYGEILKPETINYRSYKPEKDGLFCEKIFGPVKDYECHCGKYKGIRYRGIICDRCGVEVTRKKVRRERMGHITLAVPVVHIWYLRSIPSKLSYLAGISTKNLERIVYYEKFLVIEPGKSGKEKFEMIDEPEYLELEQLYGFDAVSEEERDNEDFFYATMGGEALKEMLARMNLVELRRELEDVLKNSKSKQKREEALKRLKVVKTFLVDITTVKKVNKPEWMVVSILPVIPPELRPLVPLDGGRFAASDLNDLYRRIIIRNNRLKQLMEIKAPDVILRNEKRMLQESVDALFDNNRRKTAIRSGTRRPLKSISDMIRGKTGRFRQNLLGKRVDYSGRSVIVVGPELQLHECGLPKNMALELFKPHMINELMARGYAQTPRSAKLLIEDKDPIVYKVLEYVVQDHPVLLNRAPTLHRLGIQAFQPVLVDGKALRIHPLVCAAFNADFDGDQMAVHLPLSVEAQTEAHVLMLSTHNIFSPAHGNPLVSPSQDIVMGVYFLTFMDLNDTRPDEELMKFRNAHEAILAYDFDRIQLQERIQVRLPRYPSIVNDEKGKIEPMADDGRFVTTVGRILFCEILAQGMPFYNCTLTKKGCSRVIDDTYEIMDRAHTLTLLDDMKDIGFSASTWSGLSIAITDMRIPSAKGGIHAKADGQIKISKSDYKDGLKVVNVITEDGESIEHLVPDLELLLVKDKDKVKTGQSLTAGLLDTTQKKVDRVEDATAAGAITNQERHNQLLDLWSHCREELTGELIKTLEMDRRNPENNTEVPIGSEEGIRYLNPVYLMSTSGARGNISQMQQLAGMRGLMTKPSG